MLKFTRGQGKAGSSRFKECKILESHCLEKEDSYLEKLYLIFLKRVLVPVEPRTRISIVCIPKG